MTYLKLIPALLLALPACILDKSLDDAPDPTTGEPGDTDPTGPDATTAGPTTDEPPALCPGNPDFTCTVPFNCTDFPCGGLDDLFDADGCPRPRCSADEPCPAGQVCYETGDWGTCNASGVFCEDQGGQCSCGLTTDCNDVAYCVPAEIGPPADCFAITDADACLAAGCSEASSVIPVAVDGDTCTCGEPETACLWFTGADWGLEDSPGAYYEIASGRVVVFAGKWLADPEGWASCSQGDFPPACACAELCADP